MFDGCCGGMGWMMVGGWLVGILLIALLVALIVHAVSGRRSVSPPTDAMAVLRERFARGEIDQTEYDQRARVLKGEHAVGDQRGA